MTAVAALFNRTGDPVERAQFEAVLATMRHRGPDGAAVRLLDNMGLGAQLFWTTPEEIDVAQPHTLADSPYWALLDGRIDNREELAAALDTHAPNRRSISDVELVLRAYQQWGERFVERIVGSFACVICDPVRQLVLCYRDPLGARTLYYFCDSRCLVVASEEQAVLAHPAVRSSLNELTMARYFTIREPQPGDTFFQDVSELRPATCMRITRKSVATWPYWEPASTRIRYRTDGEYAEHFRELLAESVRCRMRAAGPPAVQMSGGLDSTSLAALAAQMLTSSPHPQRLNTVSYVFKELSSVDESRRINAMAAGLPLNSLRFNGDTCWPRNRLEEWPQNPNRPDINMYRLLAQRCYRIAHLTGSRVIFTGAESDNLYTGNTEWLYDLLRDGKLPAALVELARFASPAHRRQAEPLFLYLSLRRLAGQMLRFARRAPAPTTYTRDEYPWLKSATLDLLNDAAGDSRSAVASQSLRHQGVFTSGIKWVMAAERYFAALEGVELRRPYFDRRLVEFMLAIPSYLLYNHGYMKYILRKGMCGRLPNAVIGQIQRTVYTPLFQAGMDRDRDRLAALIARPDATWTRYVRREWMESELPKQLNITRKSRRSFLVGDWCIALDAWANSVAGSGANTKNGDKRESFS